jgi:hypothetical protein
VKFFRVLPACLILLVLNLPVIAQAGDDLPTETFIFEGVITDETPAIEIPLTIRRSETRVEIEMAPLDGSLAPSVSLIDRNDEIPNVLATDPNASGDNRAASLDELVPKYGEYVITAARADVGQTTGAFTMTIMTYEEEIEADDVGIINDETPFVEIPVEVPITGTDIEIDLREITEGLDTKVYLVEDRTNTIVTSNDDDDRPGGGTNSYAYYPQAARGDYTIIATRYGEADGNTEGEFRLDFDLIEPADQAAQIAQYEVLEGDLLNTGFPIAPEFEPREQAPWTILAFYAGDNNLEDAIIADLNEFEVAGSTENVRTVVLIDRSPENDQSNDDWTSARLYEILSADVDSGDFDEETGTPIIDTPTIRDLGPVNSAEGELFAQFLVWGIRNFPSDNYVISLASHGQAWEGIIEDYTSEDILAIPELRQALNLALAETDLDKFAFLINDACLMSSVEYYEMMSDYFDYSIASPELVVNPAHDMTLFVEQLNSSYQAPDFANISEQLIDKYIEVDLQERAGSDTLFFTSSLTDLNNYDTLVTAVEDFAELMNRQNPVVLANVIGNARIDTYTYTSFSRGNEHIDLLDLMRRIKQSPSVTEEIIAAADAVISALDAVRLYENAGERVIGRIGYHNIYFPEDIDDFEIKYLEESPLKEWGRMLRNYFNAVNPNPWEGDGAFHTPIAPRVNLLSQYPTDAASITNPATLQVEIIGRNIAFAEATYDRIQPDGTRQRYLTERIRRASDDPWATGLDAGSAQWSVELPYVSDGTTGNFEYLVVNQEVGSLEARYCSPGSICQEEEDWNEVVITFNADGQLQRVISRGKQVGATAVITIPPDSVVQVYRYIVTDDNRTVAEPGNIYTWSSEGLRWQMRPAPTGTYDFGIHVTAFGGTTGFTNGTVTVNNDNLPEDVRAFTRATGGYIIPYFDAWQPVTVAFDPSGFPIEESTSENGEEKIVMYYDFVSGSADLEAIAAATTGTYGLEITSDFEPITIKNDIPALAFDLRRPAENGTFVGRGFATIIPSQGLGVVFASEVLDGAGLSAEPAYQLLTNYVDFFDFITVQSVAANSARWTEVELNDGVQSFPIIAEWADNVTTDGPWTRYAPVEDGGNPLFFATASFNLTSELENLPSTLSNVLAGYANRDAESMTITGVQTLYGVYHTWDATTYTVIRDGQALAGRLYATNLDGTTYAAWFESPMLVDEDSFSEDTELFRDVFEPILDGYQITPPAPEDTE